MFKLEFCLKPQAWLQPVDVKRLLGIHAVFRTRKESYMSEYVSIWVLLILALIMSALFVNALLKYVCYSYVYCQHRNCSHKYRPRRHCFRIFP